MGLLIGLILIFLGIKGLCACADKEAEFERDYLIAERRHQELLSVEKDLSERSVRPRKRKTTRTIAKDVDGRTIAQEIIEEGIEDE